MLVSREDFCRDGMDGLQKVVCVGAVLAQDQFQAVESFDEIGTVKYFAVFPDRVVELVQQHFILCHTEGAFQFGGVFYLKKGYIVEAVLQSEIQVFHVGSQMVGGFPACVTEKIEKKLLDHGRAAEFQQLHVPAFFVDEGAGALYFFGQVGIVDGFFNVVIDADADGIFGILKFIVGGDQDDLHEGIACDRLPAHGDAVQVRHLDIGDDDVCTVLLQRFQGGKAAVFNVGHLRAQSFPVNVLVDAFYG